MNPQESMTQPHPENPAPMVCGFAFRQHPSNPKRRADVALIRKARPAWMRGLLNGIGGKVEPGEDAALAMRREWVEETKLPTPEWTHFLTLTGTWGTVEFFRADVPWNIGEPVGPDDEFVRWFAIPHVWEESGYATGLVPNLRWLLPLALDTACRGIITVESAE